MKLNKRDCDIRIRLTPCGADFQKVQWSIGGDHHILWPSAVMGGQFSDLLDAVYRLYSEERFSHRKGIRRYAYGRFLEPNKGPQPVPNYRTNTAVHWDEEGRPVKIKLTRHHTDRFQYVYDTLDLVDIEFDLFNGKYNYRVKGQDLCYAVAKACTEALKKYGFLGYSYCSDDEQRCGEAIDMNSLLFVKAYALDVMEARKIAKIWEDPNSWMCGEASSFEKEIELLLFDM